MDRLLRIIDANFNRAREGLRVIEDGVRFYYEGTNQYIKKIKELRHSLSITIEKNFGLIKIKWERDTVHDAGKYLDTRKTGDIREVIKKNFMRVSESLRVMEEYSKITNPYASSSFHNIRFKLYRIEKDVLLSIYKKEISYPFVAVLLKAGEKTPLKSIKTIVDCMPDTLILQTEGLDDRTLFKVARKIRKIVPPEVKYLICGRPDICLLCNADGVFLDKKDIPYRDVKKLLQDRIILTDSTKIVNIPVKEITKSRLKLLRNVDGVVIMMDDITPDNTEKIIRMVKKEVQYYGRRRKEKTGKE